MTPDEELTARWRERDARYAKFRARLTPEQIAGVREWRVDEALAVGDPDLIEAARSWSPPWEEA